MDLIETQLAHPIKHWYYRHKYWALRREILRIEIIPNLLVDVGAGSALFSLELQKEFPKLNVLALDPAYTQEQLEKSSTRTRYVRELSVSSADLYLLTDVLEHVPDDVELLSRFVAQARPDATFVITVPAFMSLWSNHDVFLKHFRRYRKKQLIQVLAQSGLVVVNSQYLYSAVFPIAFIKRKYFPAKPGTSDLKEERLFAQYLLNFILQIDKYVSRFLPFGVSILAVGRKVDLK